MCSKWTTMDVLECRHGLCAPTDAVSDDVGEALAALRELGFSCCELRTVGGIPFTDLPAEARRRAAAEVHEAGLDVVLLDTQIGGTGPAGAVGSELDELRHALVVAQEVGAGAVQVYSFPATEGAPDGGRDGAVARLSAMTALAAESGIVLLVENRPGTYAATGKRLAELLAGVESPALGVVFNPAGFAAGREHPFLTAFSAGHTKNRIRCLRIRDAQFEAGRSVLPDQGNGELRELISALTARSFDGYFSLDPDLEGGVEDFRVACRAFQTIVDELL